MLFLFLVAVFTNRIFFLNKYIVFIFAPKFFIVKYDKVVVLETIYTSTNRDECHFEKDENQLCLRIRNKVYLLSTNDNDNFIKTLTRRQKTSNNTGDGSLSSDEK